MKNKCIVENAFFSKILFENPVSSNARLRMQPRSANVQKMTGIFTKTHLATLSGAKEKVRAPTLMYIVHGDFSLF